MEVQPLVEDLGEYPFTGLEDARVEAGRKGRELIDFGIGAPAEPVPEVVRAALLDAVASEEISRYPAASGLSELREAIADWIEKRYGVEVDPEIEVLPTMGSKEPIYHLAGLLHWSGSHRDLVFVTTPGYPVPARAARLAGAQVVDLPLDRENGWLPRYEEIPDEVWHRISVIWINSPNNPTGSVAPLDFYEELADRCRRHGVVLASDEAYSEIWAGPEPPPSVLQVSDPTHVLAFHSLSKRSAIPGYRSGFVCGDPLLVGAMRTLRPTMGVTPPLFVQKASVAAWRDEEHVELLRERFRSKREIMLPALERYGLPVVGGDAGFFLWCEVPGGDEQAAFARLRDLGILAAPGSMFRAGGEGHIRFALVPGEEACRRAATILDGTSR
jgi:succinyldiaminopimelate transaminase